MEMPLSIIIASISKEERNTVKFRPLKDSIAFIVELIINQSIGTRSI